MDDWIDFVTPESRIRAVEVMTKGFRSIEYKMNYHEWLWGVPCGPTLDMVKGVWCVLFPEAPVGLLPSVIFETEEEARECQSTKEREHFVIFWPLGVDWSLIEEYILNDRPWER